LSSLMELVIVRDERNFFLSVKHWDEGSVVWRGV